MKNQAFTLIELLVVVLIIGILAAIAVPKYQTAVDKAQFANLQAQAKSIKSAYDTYYQTTGEYPDSFDKLDINFSSSYQYTSYSNESCVIFPDTYCCFGKERKGIQSANIICGRNDYQFAYYMRFSDTIGSYCYAANENDRAQRLCSNMGKVVSYWTSMNMIYPYGHNDNSGKKYSVYQITANL